MTELTEEMVLVSRSKVVAKESHVGTTDPGTEEYRQILHEVLSVPFQIEDGTESIRITPPDELASISINVIRLNRRGW